MNSTGKIGRKLCGTVDCGFADFHSTGRTKMAEIIAMQVIEQFFGRVLRIQDIINSLMYYFIMRGVNKCGKNYSVYAL